MIFPHNLCVEERPKNRIRNFVQPKDKQGHQILNMNLVVETQLENSLRYILPIIGVVEKFFSSPVAIFAWPSVYKFVTFEFTVVPVIQFYIALFSPFSAVFV